MSIFQNVLRDDKVTAMEHQSSYATLSYTILTILRNLAKFEPSYQDEILRKIHVTFANKKILTDDIRKQKFRLYRLLKFKKTHFVQVTMNELQR